VSGEAVVADTKGLLRRRRSNERRVAVGTMLIIFVIDWIESVCVE
jgi:hypothetical protein